MVEEEEKKEGHRIPGASSDRYQQFDGFKTKTINFLGRDVAILLQNEFGPCALLALVNVLLLRNQLNVSSDYPSISLETVVSMIGNHLLESNGSRSSGDNEVAVHTRQGLNDAIALLPRMESGLDVNLRFCGHTLFEYTECLSVFDLSDVSLVHGWICDPEAEQATAEVLGSRSYNELIESLVTTEPKEKDSPDESKREEERLLIKDFFDRTASQLTYYGIAQLHQRLRENELAVLYRNLHFSTLFKYQDALYVLVTDLGYASQPSVVWEKLDDIHGDTIFVNHRFATPALMSQAKDDSLDPDFLVALQLSQQDQTHPSSTISQHQQGQHTQPNNQEDADFRAALELQLQLNDQEQAAQHHRRNQPPSYSSVVGNSNSAPPSSGNSSGRRATSKKKHNSASSSTSNCVLS